MKLKNIDEIRADMQKTGLARFYYSAARRMLLNQFADGTLPQKEPKLEAGKNVSDKKQKEFWNYHLFKQMLEDKRLMDAYLLGEPIIPKWTTEQVGKKEYEKVKFYPEGKTQKVVRFIDE